MHTDFRNATTADLPGLQGLARDVIHADYRSFLGDEGTDRIIDSGAIDDYLAENIADCVVVTSDSGIAGFAICKGALIALMMIAPGARGEGVGAALLRHCEAALFRSSARLTLESFEGNTRAHEFYRRHGWRLAERNEYSSNGVVTYVFLKDQPT